MIEKIRDYISTCSYLDDYTELTINYLVDSKTAYSVNEGQGYDPVVDTYTNGSKEMQFVFTLDSRLVWNEDLENNIKNSKFFENFSNWLENNDDNGIFPSVNGIIPETIRATSNGFIYATDSNEAIYRIECIFTYLKYEEGNYSI